MIKIYSGFTLWMFIFTNFFSINIAKADDQSKKLFIVTAYYSPLPNQKVYLRWSYERDIRLNWNWVAWASGKKVFPWMLRAPKTYSFWTKLFLEWFWTWEISDRWWAIITLNKWWEKIDRIDIWMWYGEEWLKRALSWWKRQVYGNFVDNNSKISVSLSSFPSPNSAIKTLEKQEEDFWILVNNIGPESSSEKIKEVQKIFNEMWKFDYEIDWVFNNKLKETIIKYQFEKELIDSRENLWAWYVWPKTRDLLRKDYLAFLKHKEEYAKLVKAEEDRKSKLAASKKEEEKKIDKLISEKVEEHISNIWNPENWEVSQNVRALQQTMKILWYFDVKDTAIFWAKTEEAIINYQIDKWIIKDNDEKNAWVIDKKTLASIKEDLKVKIKDELKKDKKLISLK